MFADDLMVSEVVVEGNFAAAEAAADADADEGDGDFDFLLLALAVGATARGGREEGEVVPVEVLLARGGFSGVFDFLMLLFCTEISPRSQVGRPTKLASLPHVPRAAVVGATRGV